MFDERWKTPMEQKSKESFFISTYSIQEPDGMNEHAGFFGYLYER